MRDRPGLVREALSLLWAARRGLSEAELMDLLGGNGEPLPGSLLVAALSGSGAVVGKSIGPDWLLP